MLHLPKFDMAVSVKAALQTMGIYDQMLEGPYGRPVRCDANETAAMARELEYVFAEVYRQEFPDLVGRSLIPVKTGVPSGAEAHTFTEVKAYGKASIVHNYATDFPSTEVQGTQYSQMIRSLGGSYQYSVQDVRAAQLTKINMPTEKAIANRDQMERLLDGLVLTGDTNSNLIGLNSPSLVANFNAVAKKTAGTTWLAGAVASPTTIAAEILADVRALFSAIPVATLNKHRANTLVVDTATYNFLAFTERGFGSNSLSDSTTLLQYLLSNVPGLQQIVCWPRLDAAGAGGKSRIFAMDRNPNVIYQVLPQDFEQFPPQARGLAFIINCHMRWGGVVCPYPKAIAYMDGTGA